MSELTFGASDVYSMWPIGIPLSVFVFLYVLYNNKGPGKHELSTTIIETDDFIGLAVLVVLPVLSYFSMIFDSYWLLCVVLTAYHFEQSSTHIAWSMGLGEPKYMSVPYKEGIYYNWWPFLLGLFSDLFSYVFFYFYCHMNRPELLPSLSLLLWWNLGSHFMETVLLLADPTTFYKWIFSPFAADTPYIIKFAKWLEGWSDSLGHMYCFAIVCTALSTHELALIVFIMESFSYGTLKVWTERSKVPTGLGFLPPKF